MEEINIKDFLNVILKKLVYYYFNRIIICITGILTYTNYFKVPTYIKHIQH